MPLVAGELKFNLSASAAADGEGGGSSTTPLAVRPAASFFVLGRSRHAAWWPTVRSALRSERRGPRFFLAFVLCSVHNRAAIERPGRLPRTA